MQNLLIKVKPLFCHHAFSSEVTFFVVKAKRRKFSGIIYENISIVEETLSKFIKRIRFE